MGATGGDGTGEDESYGVGHDFEDDDPPGRCSLHCFDSSVFAAIAGFHASLLSLLGVGQDGLDLFFVKFYFHDLLVYGLLFTVLLLISKSGAKVRPFSDVGK